MFTVNRLTGRRRVLPNSLFALLIVWLTLSVSVEARAQNDGALLLFSDPEYEQCSLEDTASQQHTVYVVHFDDMGVRGSEFGISQFEGEGLTYISESVPWASIGSVPGGLSVLYGGDCLTGPVLVCSVVYSGSGTSPPCSYLKPRPSGLDRPAAIAINCLNEIILPLEGRLYINPDPSCPCEPVVPVEKASWGRIKALYE